MKTDYTAQGYYATRSDYRAGKLTKKQWLAYLSKRMASFFN